MVVLSRFAKAWEMALFCAVVVCMEYPGIGSEAHLAIMRMNAEKMLE